MEVKVLNKPSEEARSAFMNVVQSIARRQAIELVKTMGSVEAARALLKNEQEAEQHLRRIRPCNQPDETV